MDGLSQIEGAYGSVAEYYRSMEEKDSSVSLYSEEKDTPTGRDYFSMPEAFETKYLSDNEVDIFYQGNTIGHVHFNKDDTFVLNIYPGYSELFKEHLTDISLYEGTVEVGSLSRSHLSEEDLALVETKEGQLQLVEKGYMLDELAYVSDTDVREAVAKTGYLIEELYNDEDDQVRKACAECALLFDKGDVLMALSNDPCADIRRLLAENGLFITELYADESAEVREAAARNLRTHCTKELLSLLEDDVEAVRVAAAETFLESNAFLAKYDFCNFDGFEVLYRLSQDSNKEIKDMAVQRLDAYKSNVLENAYKDYLTECKFSGIAEPMQEAAFVKNLTLEWCEDNIPDEDIAFLQECTDIFEKKHLEKKMDVPDRE